MSSAGLLDSYCGVDMIHFHLLFQHTSLPCVLSNRLQYLTISAQPHIHPVSRMSGCDSMHTAAFLCKGTCGKTAQAIWLFPDSRIS